jgi:chemotaxis protein MotA
MDLSTVVGLSLGLAILISALCLGHVPLSTLLNPEALLIVFGGTVTATTVSFSQATLLHTFGALKGGSAESRLEPRETIHYIMEVVGFVRDAGVLALQPMLESVEIPFFKKGLSLVLDNRTEKFIRDSLSTEIEVIYRQTMDYARVYETAGGFAPTMGIIGAVIGLIHTVEAFHDPARLGTGVASAFSATLYGVALSNLFLLPLAGKMRQRARDEWFMRTLLLEAVLSIRSGEHPMLIEERLNAFIHIPNGPLEESVEALKPSKHYASRPGAKQANSSHARHGQQEAILPTKAIFQEDYLQVGSRHY